MADNPPEESGKKPDHLLFKSSVFSSHLRSHLRETLDLVQKGEDAIQILSSKKDQPVRVVITQDYFLELYGRASVLAMLKDGDDDDAMEFGGEAFRAAVDAVKANVARTLKAKPRD